MTTSFISPLSQNLSGQDLQALSDFALEAPYEWRKLFTALLEDVRGNTDDLTAAEERQKVAEEEVESKTEALETATADLAALKAASVKLLGEVRTIQMELVGKVLSKWQGQMNQALNDFEGVLNDT